MAAVPAADEAVGFLELEGEGLFLAPPIAGVAAVLDAAAVGLSAEEPARRSAAGGLEDGREVHAPGVDQRFVDVQHQGRQPGPRGHHAEGERPRLLPFARPHVGRQLDVDRHLAIGPGHLSVRGDHVGPGTAPDHGFRAVAEGGEIEILDDPQRRRIPAEDVEGAGRGGRRGGGFGAPGPDSPRPFPGAPGMIDVVGQQPVEGVQPLLLPGGGGGAAAAGEGMEGPAPEGGRIRSIRHVRAFAGGHAPAVERFVVVHAFGLAVDDEAAQAARRGADLRQAVGQAFGRDEAQPMRAERRGAGGRLEDEARPLGAGIGEVGAVQPEARLHGPAFEVRVDAARIRAALHPAAGGQAELVRPREVARVE